METGYTMFAYPLAYPTESIPRNLRGENLNVDTPRVGANQQKVTEIENQLYHHRVYSTNPSAINHAFARLQF
jgi:hypothetical protein